MVCCRISVVKSYFWLTVYASFFCFSFLLSQCLFCSDQQLAKFTADYGLNGYENQLVYFILPIWLVSVCLAGWGVYRFLKHRRLSNRLNDFLFSVTSLPDEQAKEILSLTGLVVSANKIVIDQKYFSYASPSALSYAVTFLLYLESRYSLNWWLGGQYSVFHELADLLMANYDEKLINEFVKMMGEEKGYLGNLLVGALKRRDLEQKRDAYQDLVESTISCFETSAVNTNSLMFASKVSSLSELWPYLTLPSKFYTQ